MEGQKTYYILEKDCDVSIYTDREKALKDCTYFFSRLTACEKENIRRYRLYGLQAGIHPFDVWNNLSDYIDDMLFRYR